MKFSIRNFQSKIAAALAAISVTLASIVSSASPAHAPGGIFGVGLSVGSQTALTAKKWTSEFEAFDVGVGTNTAAATSWIFADYLWHLAELAPAENLLPYIGIGGGLGFNRKIGPNDSSTDYFGRMPMGLTWHPWRVPLGLFAEVIPAAVLVPALAGYVDAGVGARYFF